ncbi:methylenetetrahydrofolate--tRNA-(uracil-5-)-methyltransferase [Candidatus Gastranaerophilus sp. (ex Termes propinquus)]|nr:methylenetetrahydrofolate--tRNA-(uracil-5-)-methyltransferase [Candidatus Gastranaerophilus sp. (ex Termes propinquus)]
MKIKIIGAGLAGSEAALYLSKNPELQIELYEMRPQVQTGAHASGHPGELVCSNSLGSSAVVGASGLLKEEVAILGSELIPLAFKHRVPSGSALSVDRFGFCEDIARLIENTPNISLIREEIKDIPKDCPCIVCTGPLTSEALCGAVKTFCGGENFKFYDAIAPIVKAESINFDIAFRASRWESDESVGDYINCPMDAEQYENFYNILINSERAPLKEFEAKYFEGCMPVEVLASRGIDTLRFGPLKPVGLFDKRSREDKHKKHQFHAVVQLRQDDKAAELYNLVGFQTNLKWGAQKDLIQAIPGLENAEVVRFGVMHANTFINSPNVLNKHLQALSDPNVFFAGQITGVEGYTESIATGLFAAINLERMLFKKPLLSLPNTTMLGALLDYITFREHKNFQPTNSNWGIVERMQFDKKPSKEVKNLALAERSLSYLKNLKNDKIQAQQKEQQWQLQ